MRAVLHLQLTDAAGRVLAERRQRNTVMASGAQLIASLFSGTGGPITHMAVGTSDAGADDVAVTALINDDANGEALTGDTTAALPPTAFTTTTVPERRVVRVRVRGTLPPAAAVGTIREAGLVSQADAGTVLYNRVVFAPIVKGDDHELTLFWDVDFPFGDLQWLV